MSTKQFGIIFTLAGLIICVGLLSIKLNSEGLNIKDPADLAAMALEGETPPEGEQPTNTDGEEDEFFYTSRSERNQKDAEVVKSLEAAVKDASTSAEVKKNAQNELLRKTKLKDFENRIEINVKNKGFKEALCYIEGDKAKIYVKGNAITQDVSREIKEAVQNIAGITNLSIEVKK